MVYIKYWITPIVSNKLILVYSSASPGKASAGVAALVHISQNSLISGYFADPIAALLLERDRYKPLFIHDTQLNSSTSNHPYNGLLYSIARGRLYLADETKVSSGLADRMARKLVRLIENLRYVVLSEYLCAIIHVLIRERILGTILVAFLMLLEKRSLSLHALFHASISKELSWLRPSIRILWK